MSHAGPFPRLEPLENGMFHVEGTHVLPVSSGLHPLVMFCYLQRSDQPPTGQTVPPRPTQPDFAWGGGCGVSTTG